MVVERHAVAAQPGHQFPVRRQVEHVLGKDGGRFQLGAAQRQRTAGVGAGKGAGHEVVRIDHRAARVWRIVGQEQSGAIPFHARHEAVFQAGDPAVERDVEAVADLLLVVQDFQVAVAVDPRAGRVEGIALGVAPVALAGHVVALVAHAHAGRGLVVHFDAPHAVVVLDQGVIDVKAQAFQAVVQLAVAQRRAEVAGVVVVAGIDQQGHCQVAVGAHGDGARDVLALVAGVCAVAIALLCVGKQRVRHHVVDGTAHTHAAAHRIPRAGAGIRFAFEAIETRLLGHVVDRRADGAVAVQHRRRTAQHLHRLQWPGRERVGDGAHRYHQPGAIDHLRHRIVAGKAACREAGAAVARRRRFAHARHAHGGVLGAHQHPFGHVGAAHAADAGRSLACGQTQARTGAVFFIEAEAAIGGEAAFDHFHRGQGGVVGAGGGAQGHAGGGQCGQGQMFHARAVSVE